MNCTGWPTADQWTAFGTWILALGVIVALVTYWWQQKASRIVEAGNLVRDWNSPSLRDFRRQLDRSLSVEATRIRVANEIYTPTTDSAMSNFIEETARLAERIEVYIRNQVADEKVIAELLRYDVLSTYYFVQDLLKLRSKEEDLDYEGWRDLTLRFQDLSRIYPLSVELRDELKWYDFPPLEYRVPGDHSLGYTVPLFRRAMLWFINRAKPVQTLKQGDPEDSAV